MTDNSNVIDNNNLYLRDVLLQTLPGVESVSFALGYFFISGFAVIIEPVKKLKKLRLLISNVTDKPTAEALVEGLKAVREIKKEILKSQHPTEEQKEESIKKSDENIKKSLELMEQSDDDQNVVASLIEMMKSKKIEVRIYSKEKLHAKAYLFDFTKQYEQTTGMKGSGIVGSSNLSLAGIEHSSELNLRTLHPSDYDQLKSWFENLWNEGLEYTEKFEIILNNSWAGKTYSPYDVYIKSIYHEVKDRLGGQHEFDPVWGTFLKDLFPFQRQAVDQCLTLFEQHGGIILADVVGLGKTYIGIALLKYLESHGYRPMIICPPNLMDWWEMFCEKYEIDAKILSRGKLSSNDFDLVKNFRFRNRDLVLIDESHHFRNSNSRQYENLITFMHAREAKAILLTATPYSNSPEDIKNQIMLFHPTPETSIPHTGGNLDTFFREVKKGNADLVDLLRNIMIRRTRRYILSQWGKIDESGKPYILQNNTRVYFPKRIMSSTRYKIEKVYQNKYDRIVSMFSPEHLSFARYSPGSYLKEEYQDKYPYNELKTSGTTIIALMKLNLLKRMESSLQAFKDSINMYINTHKMFLNLLNDGIIPIGDLPSKELYAIAQNDPEFIDDLDQIQEIAQKIREGIDKKYNPNAFDMEKLKNMVKSDLKIFEEIRKLVQDIDERSDDKLNRLQKMLNEEFSGKKILVFTEYTSTARYLNKFLKWNGKKMQVDASTHNYLSIVRKFDPENNPIDGEDKIEKQDQVSLIISTDVLAEGVNLQAGEVIINYDFHWNPIRLIQRTGRIDRIGSKHEEIKIRNFLPDPKIEQDLGIEAIVDHKINEIQRVIGQDAEILKETENINNVDLYAMNHGDDRILDKEEDNLVEPSKFEKLISKIQIEDSDYWDKFKEIPDGVRTSMGEGKEGRLIMACESGSQQGKIRNYYSIDNDEEITELQNTEVLGLHHHYQKTIINYFQKDGKNS